MIITKTRFFSTFQVAKICSVHHTTVINWANKGRLKARSTPGGHRRIEAADLVDFMRLHDMPIPADLLQRPKRIFIVEDDLGMQVMLTRALESLPDVEIACCAGGLDAIIAIGKAPPDLLVLDINIPQVNGVDVCRALRANEATKPVKIIAISGEVLDPGEWEYLGDNADGFFAKPLPALEFRDLAADLLDLDLDLADVGAAA